MTRLRHMRLDAVDAAYSTYADDLWCDGGHKDEDGGDLNCLDIDLPAEECCLPCLGWWAICELRARIHEDYAENYARSCATPRGR